MPTKKTRAERARDEVEGAAITAINAALASVNQPELCAALLDMVKLAGINDIARRADMNRGSIYAALNHSGNPTLGVVLSLMNALNLTMHVDRSANGSPLVRRRVAPNHGHHAGVRVTRRLRSHKE
ncbi:MAG: hypothetical protein DMF06_05245 [Verrucomicrobia bacterium]|nr:MAG: hypothetical protein DMF06_05245 [Verrucomicrobiota bacterium]